MTPIETILAETEKMRREIEHLTAHDQMLADANKELICDCERLTAERDTLRTFALWVMEAWPDDGFDGSDLQDKAVELGLLKMTVPIPREPCGEGCRCAEYYSESEFSDGQVICYRRTALLMGDRNEL